MQGILAVLLNKMLKKNLNNYTILYKDLAICTANGGKRAVNKIGIAEKKERELILSRII